MKLSIITCAVAMMLTLVFGCSSSSSSPSNGSAANTGDGPSTDNAQTFPYAGFLQISNTFATGLFEDTSLSDESSCTTTLGSCSLTDCQVATDAGEPVELSAGDVTIYMPKLPSPAVVHYDASKAEYMPTLLTGTSFVGGDMLDISAPGDTIHAFSTSIAAPNDITVTAPVATESTFTIDTSSDLNVAWSNGSAGSTVKVYVSGDFEPGRSRWVTCSFDATAGSGTVPVALLSDLGTIKKGSFAIYPQTATAPICDNTSIQTTVVGAGATGTVTTP